MNRRICSIERSTGIVDCRASMKPPPATSSSAANAAAPKIPINDAYCSRRFGRSATATATYALPDPPGNRSACSRRGCLPLIMCSASTVPFVAAARAASAIQVSAWVGVIGRPAGRLLGLEVVGRTLDRFRRRYERSVETPRDLRPDRQKQTGTEQQQDER